MAVALINDNNIGNVASATLSFTPTAGNYLLLTRGATTAFNFLSSITQTNVAWSLVATYSVNKLCEVWIGAVSGSPGTGMTFNFTGGGISSMGQAQVGEWTDLTGSVDTALSGANGNSTTPTTASLTPTASAAVLLIATVARANTYSSGPSGGWTGYPSSTGSNRTGYLVVASASGSYSTTWTYTSAIWDCTIIAMACVSAGASTWGAQLSDQHNQIVQGN